VISSGRGEIRLPKCEGQETYRQRGTMSVTARGYKCRSPVQAEQSQGFLGTGHNRHGPNLGQQLQAKRLEGGGGVRISIAKKILITNRLSFGLPSQGP
jgi:hypothetical protein